MKNEEPDDRLFLGFWKLMADRRFDEAEAMLAPDWCFTARSLGSVDGGKMFPVIAKIFQEVSIRHVNSQIFRRGSDVVLLAEGRARFENGVEYNNHYAFLMRTRSGKISEIAEYSDTNYAVEVLYANLPADTVGALGNMSG